MPGVKDRMQTWWDMRGWGPVAKNSEYGRKAIQWLQVGNSEDGPTAGRLGERGWLGTLLFTFTPAGHWHLALLSRLWSHQIVSGVAGQSPLSIEMLIWKFPWRVSAKS